MGLITVLSKNEKNIIIFYVKIEIFTAVNNCCILHGCVSVMSFVTLKFIPITSLYSFVSGLVGNLKDRFFEATSLKLQ